MPFLLGRVEKKVAWSNETWNYLHSAWLMSSSFLSPLFGLNIISVEVNLDSWIFANYNLAFWFLLLIGGVCFVVWPTVCIVALKMFLWKLLVVLGFFLHNPLSGKVIVLAMPNACALINFPSFVCSWHLASEMNFHQMSKQLSHWLSSTDK